MKRLKIGPELKMPKFGSSKLRSSNFKVPRFAQDVFYDLRDRRLLPLVALVFVAILAVPFLLGGSDEPAPPPGAAGAAAEATELRLTDGETLAVVQAKPGLRDYRKRLHNRTPNDPFKQKYTGLPPSAQLESTVSTSSTAESEDAGEVAVTDEEDAVTVEVDESGNAPDPGGGSANAGSGSGSASDPGARQFYAYRPDVRFGVAGSEELNERSELPIGSLLPKKDPVAIFLGVTEDGKRAVFDISSDVVMVKDGGECIGGRQECDLLFMGAGGAATVVATPGRTFRLSVDSIKFVSVERPKPAGASRVDEPRVTGFSQSFTK